ncbi:RNA methyltransferase [Aliifodinibius sp. S!AR15-10]|uniref:TrmH family RNA methyltransferase n=1 Tax=Aliifodinibius sp. S!AR15-10 TaxID=2950437 RepID=UPI00285EA8CA|nr:RNA methyltransferase [Aliifodinibius sp. S!AR15-10]MDR8393124.1 RNA methyltransferase [Aliifodinibius sp. S!AR15-10]
MDSISNRQRKLLRKLQQKKYREKEQLFLVEGERAVEQVIENGILMIEGLFFDERSALWQNSRWSERVAGLSSVAVDTDTFLELADTQNPQGILALCQMPQEADLDELAKNDGVIVATDRIQDPGNLGTIVRTAAWFDAIGLLLGKGTVDLFNPKVVRSTAGTTGALPFANVDLQYTLNDFAERRWQILLLDASTGAENLRALDTPAKTVLVIGNEANGIDASLLQGTNRRKIEIPSPAEKLKVESLNASIALSIALYALAG